MNGQWGTERDEEEMEELQWLLNTLVDGETVMLGDIEAYTWFEENPDQLIDGVHMTITGYEKLGELWAQAYQRTILDPIDMPHYFTGSIWSIYTKENNVWLQYTIEKDSQWFTLSEQNFANVLVDSEIISPDNYDISGNWTYTNIILKPDYLNTHSDGEHILTIRFTDGIVISDIFTIKNKSMSSWGGWGYSLVKDNCADWDYSASFYDGSCGKKTQPDKLIEEIDNVDDSPTIDGDSKDNHELQSLYEWAYSHHITTLAPLDVANPNGVLFRGHLAKMIVNYATNVLGRELPAQIPSSCRRKDGWNARENDEIKEYAIKACSLWLMGIDIDYFQPYKVVTRAQFGTILSRLLRQTEYAGGTPYYARHLEALKTNGIMTQIDDPEDRAELRQWVWLMLLRSV